MTRAINKIQNDQAKQFAIACYDTNSIDELRTALTSGADETDMKTWNISAEQWREAIDAALHDRIADEND